MKHILFRCSKMSLANRDSATENNKTSTEKMMRSESKS